MLLKEMPYIFVLGFTEVLVLGSAKFWCCINKQHNETLFYIYILILKNKF